MRALLLSLALYAACAVASAATPVNIASTDFTNPGNGEYQIIPGAQGIQSITVFQVDPSVPLAGTITFYSGNYSMALNLATERTVILAGPIPAVRMVVEGVQPTDKFNVILR